MYTICIDNFYNQIGISSCTIQYEFFLTINICTFRQCSPRIGVDKILIQKLRVVKRWEKIKIDYRWTDSTCVTVGVSQCHCDNGVTSVVWLWQSLFFFFHLHLVWLGRLSGFTIITILLVVPCPSIAVSICAFVLRPLRVLLGPVDATKLSPGPGSFIRKIGKSWFSNITVTNPLQ